MDTNVKSKKPIYKKWWFWLLIVVVLFAIGSNGEDKTADKTAVELKETTIETSKDETTEKEIGESTEEVKEVKEEKVPRDYTSALKKAKSYAKSMHMSKAGIYDQLTSEYGEKFPAEAAQYAVDNLEYDWNANALKKAQSYAENMDMSTSAIYDQLTSEYGEKFTAEEAQYAVDNLE